MKIIVGKIINSHGIKGEIKIKKTGQESFDRDIDYFIGDDHVKVKLVKARHKGDIAIVKLEGYDNINDILVFKNQFIYIDENDLEDLDEGSYYIKDLIGMEAYDPQGQRIGHIKDVYELEVNDIYVLETDQGEKLVPAVDEFIKSVDLDENRMTIELIEGM